MKKSEIDIDFHTISPAIPYPKIAALVLQTLWRLRKDNIRTARFIVGKGTNSRSEPIIPDLVERELIRAKEEGAIISFQKERLSSGQENSGAFIVSLF